MFGDTLKWATDLDASGFASGAQRVNSSLGQMGMRTQAATMDLGALGTVLNVLANPMTGVALAGMAVGAALAGSVQAAAAWQSSMSGVSKTTGLTGQDLSNLSKELLDMSTRMPAAASEIANVAQVAGSLGIAAQDIAGFTEVAIQMGVGFEMSADQAATSGAKILTAFKLDTTAENMEKLGSVVNAMGDSFAATEPQVLDFLNRASFLNTTMGQTIPQIAALGTVLISTGLDADVAATGLKSFLNMATSVRSKTGGMDNWAALMNISVEELKANLAGDFNQTLIDTANAIAAIEDPVERFQAAVALAGTEGAPALLKLAGQQENLQKALGLTSDEWERAQSLQKTYAAQSETFNAQMQIFWNVVNMAGTELGTVFLPALTSGIGILADMTLGVIATGEAIYGVIEAWNEWVKLGVGKYAEMEKKYEEEHGGHWELIGGDAVWIANQIADGVESGVTEGMNRGNEALQVGVDAGMWDESGKAIGAALGKNAADEFGNEFIAQAHFANLTSLAMLDMINSQTSKANEQTATSFEHLGRKYEMLASKGGSGWYYSLFNGEGDLLGQSSDLGDFKKMDQAAAFEAITGFPAPEKGTKDYFLLLGDYINAEKTRLQESITGPSISLWDDPNNQRSWDKFIGENTDLAKQAGDLIMYELYNAQNAAIEAGDATLQESFGNVMKGLADPGSVPANVFNQSLADIIDAGYVSDGHRAAMQEIAENDAEEFRKNLVGGMAIELPSLAEIIENPKLINESFENMAKFQEGYLIPKITQNMDDVKEKLSEGVSEDLLYENYIKPLYSIYDQLPPLLQDILADLDEGTLKLPQFVDQYYKEVAGKTDEKAAAALDDIRSANAMFYGEFLSDNAQWQSYVNENGGYVGPTKLYGGYRDAVDAEIADAQAVNQKYGIATVGSIGMVAELDTTEALSATEALVADIGAMAPDMVLTLDIDHALTTWVNFFADIETTNPTMHVNVEIDAYADEIRYMVEQAIRDAAT